MGYVVLYKAIAMPIFQTAFLNTGQACAALKRLYVHDSQYDALCQKRVAIAEQQTVGNGAEKGANLGPAHHSKQLNRVIEQVEDARSRDANIRTGGAPAAGPRYSPPPTIVSDTSDGTRLVDEEQLGPVLPVICYTDVVDVVDAVRQANANANGLGGSVWHSGLEQAQRIAERLECGTASINNHAEILTHTPFGGGKMSAFGVEFCVEGLLAYTPPPGH